MIDQDKDNSKDSPPESDSERSLQGWIPDIEEKKVLCKALDDAFNYRGDVSLTLADDRQIEGYIFDRRPGADLDHSIVRIMSAENGEKIEVSYAQIARLQFSGKDPAHGKSWESWLVRWATKKAAGESADIYSEPLDDAEDKP